MCAIAGFADFRKNLEGEKAVLEAMTQTMTHRGPDAAGFWVCGHVALGHRRLRWWTRTAGRSP
jgi:asparagine synthetase B (glutamine-hydrolysing)